MDQLEIRTEQLKDLKEQLSIAELSKSTSKSKRIKQLRLMIKRVNIIVNSLRYSRWYNNQIK